MNTKSMSLGQMLQELKGQGILKTDVDVMAPLWGKHGDMCVVGGFTTTLVEERAKNHDRQHIPYGIAWRKQPQRATEHLTPTPPGIEDPVEEAALATTPPGLEQPIKEAAKRNSSPSSRELTSSASSHEGQLSQRPLQKDSLSARHAFIISNFAAGMKGTFRVVLKNVETEVLGVQFREDVPGIPPEVMDNVDRFAQQAPLGPLFVSFRDDVQEEVQDAVFHFEREGLRLMTSQALQEFRPEPRGGGFVVLGTRGGLGSRGLPADAENMYALVVYKGSGIASSP